MTASTPLALADRHSLAKLAERLLDAAMSHGSAGHARINFSAAAGGYGRDIDGLEGFTRTFLLLGFLLKGSRGQAVPDAADWYATGIAAGVDPGSPERWVRLDEHPQAKVEAASLALILDMTREWLWDELPDSTQQRVVDYLSPAVGDDTYPRINWVWFRLVVQTFLKSVGGPFSTEDMEADLATHDSFARGGGWLADGDARSYDHYAGWALHTYPTLWARMSGASDLAAARGTVDRDRLDEYVGDALALVGGDGSPLLQGRSLTYRFASAAPFWVAAMADVPGHTPGALRHAALSVVNHFVERGAPNAEGVMTVGWHHEWPAIAQSYTGPGSPYWASKGLLGLALEADHPVWTGAAEALPVERGDFLKAIATPGWIASGTRSDGIVRISNHGTDHAHAGDAVGDSPLYARLGYSTATSPMLDASSWVDPLDQSVCLVDRDGHATHRAGMQLRELAVDGEGADAVAVAVSEGKVRWLEPRAEQQHHGYAYEGIFAEAGDITVMSILRGPYELRMVRVNSMTDAARERDAWLRVAGWPVACDGATVAAEGLPCVVAVGPRQFSRLSASSSDATASATSVADAGPLGAITTVPWVRLSPQTATWTHAMAELSGFDPRRADAEPQAEASYDVEVRGNGVAVTWPDGVHTRTLLTQFSPSPDVLGRGERAAQISGPPR